MKLFEIVFILLLLLPIAALMRFFVSRLSSQVPRQGKGGSYYEDTKPSVRKWRAKRQEKRQRVKENREKETEGSAGSFGQRHGDRPESIPGYRSGSETAFRSGSESGFSPRYKSAAQGGRRTVPPTRPRPVLRRTERIPFSEIYGDGHRPPGKGTNHRRQR